MNRKLYFDSHYGTSTYALTEDGILTEYSVENESSEAAPGNIYKGRVTDVLNGMQAAFIDCGLDKHCYISAVDLQPVHASVGEIDIPEVLDLHVGDEILVQITKSATGKKGAKVTTNLSFVGKYIVYLPTTPFVGVSHKIDDEELRNNLIFSAKKYLEGNEGLIVRTAAPYALNSTKCAELNYFRTLYKNILSRFEAAPCGELLYGDSPIHSCVLRDMLFTPGDEVHIGNEKLYNVIKGITETYPESERPTLIYHNGHTDMLYDEGVSEQFLKTLQPKAELKNGAHIVINQTEALTAIDVNTGKFTGEDSLEDTVFSANILAAREIARQVRLRNLGGIFVVDFIDMQEESHKKAVVTELEQALKKDKGRCKVLPMSEFGLVEFTRKRTGTPSAFIKMCPCKSCDGAGIVRSLDSLTSEFRARLLDVLQGGAGTVCCDLNFDLANFILGYDALKQDIAALYPQARVYIVAHRTYKEKNMYFRRVDIPNFTLPEGTMLLY